jgi:hypothetical protein
MTTEGPDQESNPVLRNAIGAECLHLCKAGWRELDHTRDPGELLDEVCHEALSSFVAATMGAAVHHLRTHPHDQDPSFQKLAKEAERVAASLSPRLHRLWEMHYVEGHPLAVYAESTGLDATAAQVDYFAIIQELVPLMMRGRLRRRRRSPALAARAEWSMPPNE